jgi:hypothetical protein
MNLLRLSAAGDCMVKPLAYRRYLGQGVFKHDLISLNPVYFEGHSISGGFNYSPTYAIVNTLWSAYFPLSSLFLL